MEENNAGSSKFKKVCVFCGSNPGNRQVFSDAAIDLGNELVKRKMDLVYGGGSVGLMGLISRKVFNGGSYVLGVIPKALMPIEISGETVGEVRIVADMHERKAEMAREAEAFIALPGGYGTMEEMLEMITWAQLGIHKKPVGLLNVDGYYDCLLQLFDNGVKEGFIKPGARDIVVSAPNAEELLTKMELPRIEGSDRNPLVYYRVGKGIPSLPLSNSVPRINMLRLMKAGKCSNWVNIQAKQMCSDSSTICRYTYKNI